MDLSLPSVYLVGLVGLLAVLSLFVGIQIRKVRRDESSLRTLQEETSNGSKDPVKLYELGSVQLRKRLFIQAAESLRKASRCADGEPVEGRALICNALGYALAAQQKYPEAIVQYQKALKVKPDYLVALNNLGYALERQQQREAAAEVYGKTLELDAGNTTARRRLQRLQKSPPPGRPDRKT